MGAKEILLKDLCDSDHSGGTELIHNALIAAGLKYKGSSNSQTLLYYFRRDGNEIGIAAMRGSPALLSLPTSFWRGRANLRDAIDKASPYYIEPEGFVSTSQYSAGQLRITTSSLETLLSIINDVIIPEARTVGHKQG